MSDSTPSPGDTVTWTVVVDNDGPDPSGELTLEFDVPVGLSFAGLAGPRGFRARQLTAGWVCSSVNGLLCTSTSIAAGERSELALLFIVDAAALGVLPGSITVSGATADPDLSDNAAAVSFEVARIPPSSTSTSTTTTTGALEPVTTPAVAPPSVPTSIAPTGPPSTRFVPTVMPGGELPATGTDSGRPIPLAVLLIAAGMAMLVIRRVRRRSV